AARTADEGLAVRRAAFRDGSGPAARATAGTAPARAQPGRWGPRDWADHGGRRFLARPVRLELRRSLRYAGSAGSEPASRNDGVEARQGIAAGALGPGPRGRGAAGMRRWSGSGYGL